MTPARKHGVQAPDIRSAVVTIVVLSIAALAGYVVLSSGVHAGPQFALVSTHIVMAGLGFSLINYAMRSLRWSLMCRRLGVSAGLGLDTFYYVAGFPMAMTPGKIGEVVRMWLMRRGHGFSYVRTAPLLLADRAYDLLALAMLAAVGVGAFAGPAWLALGGSAIVGVGGILMLCYPRIMRDVITLGYRLTGRFPRLFVKLREIAHSFEDLASLRLGLIAILLSLVGWSAETLILKLVLGEIGATIDFTAAAFVFSAGMVLGALALIPGGLGVADLSMIGLLTALGVDLPSATAATVIVRACTLWFAVGIGLVVLPIAMWIASRLERRRGAA